MEITCTSLSTSTNFSPKRWDGRLQRLLAYAWARVLGLQWIGFSYFYFCFETINIYRRLIMIDVR
jgi:hypothetical protein